MSKVSIIVPVYNSERYIRRCIESLMNQTYTDIEIIIINDGSTDKSLGIIEELAKKDSRIILINQENRGVSYARNAGLKKVSGDYIGFVDSDDYIEKQMYEKLIQAAETSDADIVECGYYEVYKDISPIKREFKDIKSFDNESYIISLINQKNTTGALWNKIFAANLFKDVVFPDFAFSEDLFINILIGLKANYKINIPDSYYYYMIHDSSAKNSSFSPEKLDDIKARESIIPHLVSSTVNNETILKHLYINILERVIILTNDMIKSGVKSYKYNNFFETVFTKYYSMLSSDDFKLIKSKKFKQAINIYAIKPKLYYTTAHIFFKIFK